MKTVKELIPYKCPVCSGCGRVLDGFYCDKQYQSTSLSFTEQCRSCKGAGIIYMERITETQEVE